MLTYWKSFKTQCLLLFYAGTVVKKLLIYLLGELNMGKWLNSLGNERKALWIKIALHFTYFFCQK